MKKILGGLLSTCMLVSLGQLATAAAPPMSAYTAYPPFINQTAPPLVMLAMSKDQKMFFKAYNDIMDLDSDGSIDTTYKDTINYYGYFDSNKCYSYNSGSNRFEPAAAGTGANLHFCDGTKWSGNFMNWATMARIDVVRKVLYGGLRVVDTGGAGATTVLQRTVLPQDNHSWVKAYNGPNIGQLTPNAWASISVCNFNSSGTSTTLPVVWVMNGYFPYAASTEVRQCTNQFNGGPALVADYNYRAQVQVCVTGMLEANCERYFNSGTSIVTHKPVGLIQRQGLNTQGTDDQSDDTILMKFAMMTGSHAKNFTGGVLRSNVVDVNNEINVSDGTIKAATSKIIKNIDNFRMLGYNYATGYYNLGGNEGTCTTSTPTDGACKSWGNPIAEVLYEAIRYVQGLTSPTSQYQASPADHTGSPLTVEGSWVDPYTVCPYCSKPYVLLFSDAFPTFDSDHLPGSYWPSAISTSSTPSVQTLIANSGINALEGIGNVFIGQSLGTYDKACTSKAGNFASIRGLCIEDPNKFGSYYSAGLAWYAKTTDLRGPLGLDATNSVKQSITTYSVAMSTPFPVLEFMVGTNKVQLVPIFHDGCPAATGWAGCTSVGQYGDDTKGSLADFKYCDNDADWTTEQGAPNNFTSCFDILWDDSEYGQDFDLDIRYRIYVKTTGTDITVRTKGLYSNSGHTNYAGFFITGVSGTGDYLEIRCGGGLAGGTDCDVASTGNETAVTTRTFTPAGAPAQFLKDPLWYAAKYGGFTDKDGNNQPNLPEEWDQDANGLPDTYFYAANPLQLESKLAAAFASILNQASSGTAASVLASSFTGDGSTYQSFFFPTQFEGTREIKWTGYLQSLFVDAYGNFREDTNQDGKLTYAQDDIVVTRFDVASSQTKVDRYKDIAPADGVADTTVPYQTVNLIDLKTIWEAGKALAKTTSASRNIWTWIDVDGDGSVDSSEFIPFTTAKAPELKPFLRADPTGLYTSSNLIDFIRGTHINGLRDRRLTVDGTLEVWKLGDPIYSTAVIVGAPSARFDIIYGDAGYAQFYKMYRTRRQIAYMGANDGMLHAFDGGFYHISNGTHNGCFTLNPTDDCNTQTSVALGKEKWAFIPQELLPHLRWLAQPDYTHVYYVDLKPRTVDVRVFCEPAGSATPPGCVAGQTGVSHPGGWGTVILGGFRMGGSCKNCSATQGAPMTYTADFDNNPGTSDTERSFYSAYFALDVTDPDSPPKLLWTFTDDNLGFSTSIPSVARVLPSTDPKNSSANEKWFALFGSGPTNYDAGSSQPSRLYAVDMATGNLETVFSVGSWNAFMGDIVTVDYNLDFRVDVAYMGRVLTNTSPNWGKLYRLTTDCLAATGPTGSCPTTSDQWGIDQSGNRIPTEVLATFTDAGGATRTLGPPPFAPSVVMDDSYKMWLFMGTGRYFSNADKTDNSPQYLVGVKDSVLTGGCTQSSSSNCHNDDLADVTGVTVCAVGIGSCTTANQVSGITGVSTYSSLIALVKSKEGFVRILPTGERTTARSTVFGGIAFFPVFVPNSDICVASGTGYLYALYYLTGGPYSTPIAGTTAAGANQNINDKLGGAQGVGAQASVQVIKSGTGGSEKTKVCQTTSTGAQACGTTTPAQSTTSRYIAWINQRD
jgi:type IV pilus assembly protein PilY1